MGTQMLHADRQTNRRKDRHDEAVGNVFAIALWARLRLMLNFLRPANCRMRCTVTQKYVYAGEKSNK
jgi:hypothetical protein